MKSPELLINSASHYDAILVHGYWISRKGTNLPKNGLRDFFDHFNHDLTRQNPQAPHLSSDQIYWFTGSLRTRLATRAAALFAKNQVGISPIVTTAGFLRGPDYPSVAELISLELANKFHIPEVVTESGGYGTAEETEIFLRLAQIHGWRYLADVAFAKHYRSIQRFLPEGTHHQGPLAGLTISYYPVETILRSYDSHHIVRLIDQLGRSPHELMFGLTEAAKDFVITHGGTEKLYATNKKARTSGNDSLFNRFYASLIDNFHS
ncbi:hypothetical protein M1563_04150 [Patescibacteria group bacterium]|nr:hypothetical protein [Patescibacteria group bacterium]